MKHRLFLGLHISRQKQEEIMHWQQKFQNLPVRWIHPRNLHITLVPPWYEEDISKVVQKLQKLEGTFQTCSVEFFEVCYGPNRRMPRLVWAIGKAPQTVITLKNTLNKVFPENRERRSFLLHLTLARFRPEDFGRFRVKNLREKIVWREEFREITLFESHLGKGGAEYEVMKKIQLERR